MAETLGDRIRIQRARLKMSQGELARKVRISLTSMNAIETGNADPRASRIPQIAEALGVSTDWLFGRTEDREPPAQGERPRSRRKTKSEMLPTLPGLALQTV